jgi:hypothetical protein
MFCIFEGIIFCEIFCICIIFDFTFFCGNNFFYFYFFCWNNFLVFIFKVILFLILSTYIGLNW